MSTAALPHPGFYGIPADLRIPAPPRLRRLEAMREPAWQEAMRWSVIALTASLAAGEAALWLG